jgi:uncharacterized protein YdeI (YjbR/CyaY-like superfamily)
MDPRVDELVSRSVRWSAEMAAIRDLLLACHLSEAVKWNKPCYDVDGSNIAVMQEMKSFLALMFFKGVLLADPTGILEEQGPNSRSARRVTFTSMADVDAKADALQALVHQAIELESAGLAVPPAATLELVAELNERLESDSRLREAFENLTPGRQRGYHLYVAGAKRHETRQARVETCVPRILGGKGLRDR